MAINFLNDINKYEFSGFPIGFSRNNPIPLDKTEVWLDLAELRNYAEKDPTAYVGQKVTHVDVVNKTATVYIIADEAGTLSPVGAPTEGDEVSISLNDGILSLKDFGKAYYQYVEATDTETAYYEKVTVDADHPWAEGLEPKVVDDGNGTLTLGWFEPNPLTVDELADDIAALSVSVKGIQDTLNTTEDADGTQVPGLIAQVATLLEANSEINDALNDRYTKTEVDSLVASVFRFKGGKESVEALPTTGNQVGDVWQVGDAEYAWTKDNKWEKLGFALDLSTYATVESVNGVSDRVKTLEDADFGGQISGLKAVDENLEERIAALEEADFAGKLVAVNGNITNLQKIDEGFETRISTIEGWLGEPSDSFTSELFPTVETLVETVKELTAVGAEANQINGITINGQKLEANETDKLVALPIFNGTSAGLVPVVGEGIEARSVLTVNGWADPFGDLGGMTVKEYVDDQIMEHALSWSEI